MNDEAAPADVLRDALQAHLDFTGLAAKVERLVAESGTLRGEVAELRKSSDALAAALKARTEAEALQVQESRTREEWRLKLEQLQAESRAKSIAAYGGAVVAVISAISAILQAVLR